MATRNFNKFQQAASCTFVNLLDANITVQFRTTMPADGVLAAKQGILMFFCQQIRDGAKSLAKSVELAKISILIHFSLKNIVK
jgi:hypothetical protein